MQLNNEKQGHMSSLPIINALYSFQEKNLISFLCQTQLKEISEYSVQWWPKSDL